MKLITEYVSPNISTEKIPVEFLVLHYTACDIKKTLEIFMSNEKKVSSHFVIDANGDCYDLGGFLDGPIRRGAHAGLSRILCDGKEFSGLNSNSIGIEIVNLNGNIFNYTEAQYLSIQTLVSHLQIRFPILKNSSRIVGHEHIAGWRGKADPGLKFDWNRFLMSLNLHATEIHRSFACNESDLEFLNQSIKSSTNTTAEQWAALSSQLEKRIEARNTAP